MHPAASDHHGMATIILHDPTITITITITMLSATIVDRGQLLLGQPDMGCPMSAAPGSASPGNASATGLGQPPPLLRLPAVNTKICSSSPLVRIVNKQLGGPSLPSSMTGSPKGAGVTAFLPPPLTGHGSQSAYPPRAGSAGSRPLSPRDSRKFGGYPASLIEPLPQISTTPGTLSITRSGPIYLEHEREREQDASPEPHLA